MASKRSDKSYSRSYNKSKGNKATRPATAIAGVVDEDGPVRFASANALVYQRPTTKAKRPTLKPTNSQRIEMEVRSSFSRRIHAAQAECDVVHDDDEESEPEQERDIRTIEPEFDVENREVIMQEHDENLMTIQSDLNGDNLEESEHEQDENTMRIQSEGNVDMSGFESIEQYNQLQNLLPNNEQDLDINNMELDFEDLELPPRAKKNIKHPELKDIDNFLIDGAGLTEQDLRSRKVHRNVK